MPIAFCLAPANEPEREIAAALLERAARGELLHGQEIFITDKGFAGAEFEQFITDALGAQLVRPDRENEPPRFGALGGIRQWIESVNDTLKGQFSLERHGAPHPEGVVDARLPAHPRTRRGLLAQLARSASRAAASPPMTTETESVI